MLESSTDLADQAGAVVPQVVVTGTPGVRWLGVAAARICADPGQLRIDAGAWRSFEHLLEQDAGCRLLVFIEAPAASLAASMVGGYAGDPAEWLAGWRASAQALAVLLQTRPDLCVAVDLDEALLAGPAFAELLASEFNLRWTVDGGLEPLDPLAVALAHQLCLPGSAEARLHAVLMASCRPLFHEAPTGTAAVAPDVALRRYQQLRGGEAELESLREDHLAQQALIDRLGTALETASAQLEAAAGERMTLESTAQSLRKETERLIEALHTTQETLERALVQRRDLEARAERLAAESAQASQERDSLQRRCDETAVQLRHASTTKESLQRDLASAREALAAREAQADTTARRLAEGESRLVEETRRADRAEAEAGQLLAQLHQTQEELEALFLSRKATEERLAAAAKAAKDLETELSALKAQKDALAASSAAATEAAARRAAELEGQLDRESERVKSAEAEAGLALAQLHQTQEELEETFIARKSAENKLALTKRAHKEQASELEALRKERDALAATAERRLGALKSLREASAAERDRLGAVAEARLKALRAERLDRNQQASQLAAERKAAVSAGLLVYDEIVPTRERLEPPYRELTLEIRGLRLRSAHVDRADIRLVDHHGQAGLVIFGEDGRDHWLHGWKETGRDGQSPFALLIPGNAGSDEVLGGFDAGDRRALMAIVDGIERLTCVSSSVGSASLWVGVTRRLRSRLFEADIPTWFEDLELRPVGEGTGSVDIMLRGVTRGWRDAGTLHLRCLGGNSGGLVLLPDAWGCYPLLYPPPAVDDAAKQGQPLVLAAGQPPRLQLQVLSQLTPADREFLLACVAFVPEALSRVPGDEPGVTAEVRSQIATPAREAARALENERSLLRRLAGRLRRA